MILLLLLALFTGLLLLAGLYAYRICFYASAKNRDQTPSMEFPAYEPYKAEISRIYRQLKNRPCEFVTILSHDGLTLSGRYYHVKDGAPLDICFHGYRSSCFTDFAGGSELSFHLEHNLLLIDERAHGKSEGHTISFGILERLDVCSWIDYALARFGRETEILLYGVSMGAATVLMAAGEPLPANVKGIIADCPYSVPLDIILHVGKSNPMPQWLIKPSVLLAARIFGGFDLQQTNAIEAVQRTRVPILIIHGEADSFVPCFMSEAPQTINPELVQRHTFPGADHGICYLVDTPRYWQLVTEFVEKTLS